MLRRVLVVLAFLALVAHATSLWRPIPESAAQPPAARAAAAAPADSFAHERDSLMNVVLASIKGRESAPAESVFKNIQALRGWPAGRLVRVMNLGYGRSLGVSCGHCHVVGEWDKDDRTQKQVTREMMKLVSAVNDTLLPRVGLGTLRARGAEDRPVVNCTTCHRGAKKPALNL